MLSLVHETPNRMRFSSPVVRWNEAASRLANSVAELPGVTHVRANPLASSLVVHYRGDGAVRNAIIHRLGARVETPLPASRGSLVQGLHGKVAQAVGDAVLREMIGHLLGRAVSAMVAAVL